MQNLQLTRFTLLVTLSIVLTGCGGGGDGTADTPSAVSPPDNSAGDNSGGTGSGNNSLCDVNATSVNWQALMQEDCDSLAGYGLFASPIEVTKAPNAPGLAYKLTTELFSNYASKYRFIFVPDGQSMQYSPNSVFDMPQGTVLVKTFALPFDTQKLGADNEVKIETRLLIHRDSGWQALAYQWNQEQTQANLTVAGANVSHTMNHQGQQLSFDYHIPSKAECKICHQSSLGEQSKIIPIGLKAHLLNMSLGSNQENQLLHWQQTGLLEMLPDIAQVAQAYGLDDESASLSSRAKGYLDVNCAHCHNPTGFASISGLRLGFDVDHTSFEYGICKQPPGWDGGPDGLAYDIVPGNGKRSIVHNRQVLSEPKDKMPPLGREIVHTEGVDLIERWIDSLSPSLGSCVDG
ncbi:hypothetical protein EXU30_17065 [Shewanella maritima]|uniref:Cytochrome c domain-containing protein n=1 Tax=Shewanella maritima TaxID=2520507 RepID=A0A411PKY6_9GAMM|nr:SO2930 family diheme c-type cytochrome [Shewanella maritima]QBF84190.1 hypothetical protein EXU30_17065 [Shewanella maritima]